MKNHLPLLSCVCVLGLPVALHAQDNNANTDNTQRRGDVNERYGDWNDFEGPRQGDQEFTFGGSGFSNKDMDSSAGGVGASWGWYLNDSLLLAVRQSVSYSNPSGGGSDFAGSTRVALDQHILATGRLRPFVGVNAGGVYGDNTNDSFVAGIEAGVKFYVQPRTFLYLLADYAWAFQEADAADNNFDDGGYQWTVGIGFNF